MSAGQTAILIASLACVLAVAGILVVIVSLRRQVRIMEAVAEDLRRQLVPLVADAHRVVDQAATEMERVGAVLESTESVHSTVDSASRLAYRAFANPVVKVLAVKAGAAGGMRRLAGSNGTAGSNGSAGPGRPPPRRQLENQAGRPAGMIPKRPFWLAVGASVGAGSSLWIERRVRRAFQEAANRLQPDALAVEIGRSARQLAGSTSERVRTAVSVGRTEMRQHEEQLWQDLADHRGIRMRAPNPQASASFNGVLTEPASTGNVEEPRPAAVAPPSSGRGRGGQRAAATKSPSHLGN